MQREQPARAQAFAAVQAEVKLLTAQNGKLLEERDAAAQSAHSSEGLVQLVGL